MNVEQSTRIFLDPTDEERYLLHLRGSRQSHVLEALKRGEEIGRRIFNLPALISEKLEGVPALQKRRIFYQDFPIQYLRYIAEESYKTANPENLSSIVDQYVFPSLAMSFVYGRDHDGSPYISHEQIQIQVKYQDLWSYFGIGQEAVRSGENQRALTFLNADIIYGKVTSISFLNNASQDGLGESQRLRVLVREFRDENGKPKQIAKASMYFEVSKGSGMVSVLPRELVQILCFAEESLKKK